MMDDFVGQVSISVKEICSLTESGQHWITFNYRGMKAAEVQIAGHFLPDSSTKSSAN
jgi:hypothetical protein